MPIVTGPAYILQHNEEDNLPADTKLAILQKIADAKTQGVTVWFTDDEYTYIENNLG